MNVGEAVARAVTAESSAPIFCLMGDGNIHILPYVVELELAQLVHTRHEAAAVAMADGYARTSGQVGLASITCGP